MALISHLRTDARMTLTQLSRNTRIPVSTVFDRLRNYETSLITKHTSLLDFNKFGFFARATVILKVSKRHFEGIREFLSTHPHVNSLYKINNGFDFLVEVIFTHVKELESFLEVLNSRFIIKQKVVYYLLDEIKKEAFLSNTLTCSDILAVSG
jgi:DNA-binding Lrp family transcriptional regulator